MSGLTYEQLAGYLEHNKLDSFDDNRRPSGMDLNEQQRLLNRLSHKVVQQKVMDWWDKTTTKEASDEEE